MKNKLIDLNDHLFAQLERLGEEDLTGDKLTGEIDRSKALTSVAGSIIDNAKLCLDAERVRHEVLGNTKPMPAMLETSK